MTVIPEASTKTLRGIGRLILMLALSVWASLHASVGATGPTNIAEQGLPQALRDTLPSTSPLRLADDRGRSIQLTRSAKRIIALSPSLTELVFEAGAGDKLVGVS